MPATVIELGRAKINLSLHVVGRRADGYHLLDSVVAFADIADRLTFAQAGEHRDKTARHPADFDAAKAVRK